MVAAPPCVVPVTRPQKRPGHAGSCDLVGFGCCALYAVRPHPTVLRTVHGIRCHPITSPSGPSGVAALGGSCFLPFRAGVRRLRHTAQGHFQTPQQGPARIFFGNFSGRDEVGRPSWLSLDSQAARCGNEEMPHRGAIPDLPLVKSKGQEQRRVDTNQFHCQLVHCFLDLHFVHPFRPGCLALVPLLGVQVFLYLSILYRNSCKCQVIWMKYLQIFLFCWASLFNPTFLYYLCRLKQRDRGISCRVLVRS